MPARNSRFRALADDFRTHLDRGECWPKYGAILATLKNRGGGRKEDIARMKVGGIVPEKYVRALVELLRDKPSLAGFLDTRQVPEAERRDAGRVVEHVAKPAQSHPGPPAGEDDEHMRGQDALVGLFTKFLWGTLVRPGMLCEGEADVRAAIDLLMASIGRAARREPGLPSAEAVRAAEHHMGISRDAYLGRAVGLWRAAPWSIAFAVIDRQRVGCSIVLPLAEPAYEALRVGERDSHSCSTADLTLPARTLFLEAIGHRADAEYPAVRRKTGQVVRTIYLQLAALSLDGTGPLREDRPLRILSIAGNPTNAKRLRRSGFRPTGAAMPASGVRLMELDQREAWLTPAIIRTLQDRLRTSGQEP